MASKFKYIKKMIVTISKGRRKGEKELRYFYKGDKLPKGAKELLKPTAIGAKAKSVISRKKELQATADGVMNQIRQLKPEIRQKMARGTRGAADASILKSQQQKVAKLILRHKSLRQRISALK